MKEHAGKVILVSGGARGLGEAVCAELASQGATLVVADVDEAGARRVAEGLSSSTGALGLHLDVSDQESCREVVAEVLDRFGKLDVLVNNAGVDRTADVEALSSDDWNGILGVNLNGPFLMAKEVFPVMRKNGGGHIVNIVSTAALRAWTNASAYHASKWGLLGFSHALHAEGREHGIKVTAVISGGMRTPFLLDRFPDIDPSKLQDPKNVAATVEFVLRQPSETVIPMIMVLPMKETSWP